MPPDDEQVALRAAIKAALEATGTTQVDLGANVAHHEGEPTPYRQQTVAGWLAGRAYLAPRRVFAIEKALKLRPGTLSKIEGYAPIDRPAVVTVEEALAADPDISSEQAALLGVQLVEARRLTRERRARRSQR